HRHETAARFRPAQVVAAPGGISPPPAWGRILCGAPARMCPFFSGHVERYTPPKLIERARSFFGGAIDTDPASCAAAQNIVQANKYFSREQDGLAHPWHGRTWLNAPYSDMPR